MSRFCTYANPDRITPLFQQELDELNENTVGQIIDAGHNAALVPCNDLSLEQVLQIVDAADAVLVMGGEDVEPSLYGRTSAYPGGGHHELAADRNHVAAIQHAIATRTPLLGICRGLRLLKRCLGRHLDSAPGECRCSPQHG
ncbi:gamma-glutamyl-gamma-aminobutyrate hydrolase family protein [Glutamicibacter halophytocola]|uniref:gamma-glutamyl-gamma-aminobutyrate hydrolase family protein n=1 Tax=Glutamicibacter halophytocola TaxID=1933880 RepID=UPI003D2ADF24